MKVDFNPLVKYVAGRIKKNKNAIVVFNGATGSGKSYASLDFAIDVSKELNTQFNLKYNLDFNFQNLLKKMTLPINDGPGVCYVFEEVGSVGGGAAAMQWQSKANQLFNSFMQTNRCKNQILIMNCPGFANLDKKARELCHVQISMLGINEQNKRSYGKPFLLQTNSVTSKIYFKYLRFPINGQKTKFTRISFRLPPKEIIEEYEQMKNAFVDDLNASIMEEGAEKSKKGKKAKVTKEEIEVLRSKGLTMEQIASIHHVTERTLYNKLAYENNETKTDLLPREPGVLSL